MAPPGGIRRFEKYLDFGINTEGKYISTLLYECPILITILKPAT
jgi:hypothetical protein